MMVLGIIMMLIFSPGCEYESQLHINADMQKGLCSIGEQTWMTEPLHTTHFINGDSIPQAQSDSAWKQAGMNKQPAWCYASGDNKSQILYNWYAVSDPRGMIPKGWHMPRYEEVEYLIKLLYMLNHLQINNYDLNKAYSFGNAHLRYYEKDIDVKYSFPVNYAGQRFGSGSITKQDSVFACWTSESPEDSTGYIPCFIQIVDKKQLFAMAGHPANGLSIRCIADE